MDMTNKIPILAKWVVKYDEVWNMPQFVQGTIIGDYEKFRNGDRILIRNVEYMDLLNKTIKTSEGSQYQLVGDGRRMILLNEEDVINQIYEEGYD